jgi:hypothetical protein
MRGWRNRRKLRRFWPAWRSISDFPPFLRRFQFRSDARLGEQNHELALVLRLDGGRSGDPGRTAGVIVPVLVTGTTSW